MPKRGPHRPWAHDIILLAEVEKRPCLYDRGEEHFSDYTLRKKMWGEIGDVVGCTAVEAKQRYKYIRDAFTKRLKKARLRPETLRTPLTKFRLSQNLQFLIPHIYFGDEVESHVELARQLESQVKRKRHAEAEEILSAVSNVSNVVEVETQEEDDSSSSPTHVRPTKTPRRRPPSCKQNGEPVGDELDSFFQTICGTVRKLPSVLQSQLKLNIMEMVYKTEMGHLANTVHVPTSSEHE